MPVPETGMVFIPPDVRLSAKERLPEKLVAESGRKTTWNDALCPAANMRGKEGPVKMNSGKLLAALRTVMLWAPLFVSMTVPGELVVLTLTEPKFSEDGLVTIPALAGAP